MCKFLGRQIEFTADDEDPDCMNCDHCENATYNFCMNNCGPEYGWSGYKRTLLLDDIAAEISRGIII